MTRQWRLHGRSRLNCVGRIALSFRRGLREIPVFHGGEILRHRLRDKFRICQELCQVGASRTRLDLLRNLGGRTGARVRSFCQQSIHQTCQRPGYLRPPLFNWRNRVLHVPSHFRRTGNILLSRERWGTAEQFVQRATQAIDIRTNVHVVTVATLLGRHVVVGANQVYRAGNALAAVAVIRKKCDAEIQQLDLAGTVEHQIGRLHVTMDQTVFVRMLQTESRLTYRFAGIGYR